MKTPELLAEEFVNQEDTGSDTFAHGLRNGFLAGFKAGSQRTDAELLKAFADIKEKDSFGPKLAAFINGMRRGLKQIRDYNEKA
jgi:hypothetical protein